MSLVMKRGSLNRVFSLYILFILEPILITLIAGYYRFF